jgi:hypothetical protein
MKGNLERIDKSIDRATLFIEHARSPGGLWSDFHTLAGESVYWVSGYVGFALSRSGRGRDTPLLGEVATHLLEGRQGNAGWGYGPGVPADADSTSWCMRFLASLGEEGKERAGESAPFLLMHQNDVDGGFRTYHTPGAVGRYMGVEGVSFEGWLSSQLCVTGVAVEALKESGESRGVREALGLIRQSQEREGFWNSYWWSGALYATVHCMEALGQTAAGPDAGLLEGAGDWITRTQLPDGGWSGTGTGGVPFWTALALRGLMFREKTGEKEAIGRGIAWLLSQQLGDGSWSPAYILRIPHPAMKEPWRHPFWNRGGRAVNALICDHRRLFTTATALRTLSIARELIPG